MKRQVRIGGVNMSRIAPWGDLSWSHDAYGCREASWGASFPRGSRHPAIRVGALVEVLYGPSVIWSGEVSDANWRDGTFTAMGLAYGGERFLALDGSGNATATPSTAATQAIARGWHLAGVDTSVPTTPYLAAVDGASTCGALFDSNANELAKWWTVRADRVLRFQSVASTPRWYLRRGVVDLSDTDDGYASAVAVVYLDSATSTYKKTIRSDALAAARFGYREAPVDATVLGAITTAKANAIGDGILAKGRARLGWSGSVEVGAYDLTTKGGVPADLALVESHHVIRIPGAFEDIQFLGKPYLDVPIGSTEYVDGASTITLAPLGGSTETLADAFAEMFEAIAGKKAA